MKRICLILLLTIAGLNIYGVDEIRLVGGQSESDNRHIYPHALIEAILEATKDDHGPYSVFYTGLNFTRNRALIELEKGELINVHEAPTRAEWEEKALPIRIPIRKGLLGYRLFLINRKDSLKFNNLNSIEELKKLNAGLGSQWSTTKVMEKLNFSIITNNKYEGLFNMLSNELFDYFPRGINEVFDEYETRKSKYPEMIIEETKALYFTTPTYLFVSPKHPQLARRIEEGLLRIIDSGVFDSIFQKYYGEYIELATLKDREIYYVENPLLTDETPLNNKEFWYSP